MTDTPTPTPDPIAELRANADALHSWFKSMSDQRNDWGYPHGVEANASDALEGVYRMAHSVVAGLRQTADALAAVQEPKP